MPKTGKTRKHSKARTTGDMSLVQSLFGTTAETTSSKDNNNNNSNDLFAKIVDVPEPQMVATVAPRPQQNRTPNKAAPDDDAEDRTIFVGNLPVSFATKRRRLHTLFREFGSIESVRIRSVPTKREIKLPSFQAGNQNLVQQVAANTNQLLDDGKHSVSGYVMFAEASSVTAALVKNHSLVVDGTVQRHIRVDRCRAHHDAARTVFVGNLPHQADEESLAEHFENLLDTSSTANEDGDTDATATAVENVRIVRDKETHQCQGFGYVLLRNSVLRAQALQHANETLYMGRPLRVQVCGTKYKTSSSNKKKVAAAEQQPRSVTGAVRRILQADAKKKGRARGNKATSSGRSKRTAKQAKSTQRLQKIQKRLRTGMGKNKKK